MVDKLNGVNGVNGANGKPGVSGVQGTGAEDASIHKTGYANEAGDNLEIKSKPTFDELLEDGTLKQDKFLFWKLDSYKFVCDGEMTYGEIKELLGLEDGILRERNQLSTNKGSLDDVVPEKGKELKLIGKDFPREKASFQDDDGNEISGFEKSINGKLYYVTQSGDSPNALEDGKFKSKSLKDYNTGAAIAHMKSDMEQVWQYKKAGDLATGVAYEVPEKSWWQKIFG